MFSVTYTGTNVLPLYTAMVCPTKSGLIIEARDHVLMTVFFTCLHVLHNSLLELEMDVWTFFKRT